MQVGELYDLVYRKVAGSHPKCRPWHFQWHTMRKTHLWQGPFFESLSGTVLDVGCGDKPYETMAKASKVKHYIGLDIYDGPKVDIVVKPLESWPIDTASADAVVCSQVLEHVADPQFVLSEISRVLKPDGTFIAVVPFVYPEHGMPHDYRRISRNGMAKWANQFDLNVVEIFGAGGVGAVIATCLLSAIEARMNKSRTSRLIKGILLPAWLVFSLSVNLICSILDKLMPDSPIYCNTCLVATKSNV